MNWDFCFFLAWNVKRKKKKEEKEKKDIVLHINPKI